MTKNLTVIKLIERLPLQVVAARLEQEERRKEKHRKMEAEREKMRQNVRDKYNIKKKEDQGIDFTEGRIGPSRKTPEVG